MQPIRVVVADGYPAMRLGLMVLIGNEGDMHVVAETEGGEETLRISQKDRPNLVILGLNLLGDQDGVETCRAIKALPDAPYVLIHTAYNFPHHLSSRYLAGADGFVHKSTEIVELLDAVRHVARGRAVWLPGERIGEPRSIVNKAPAGSSLTPRQRDVLTLVLRRYSHSEIAETLHIGTQTAKNHVAAIRRKFGVRSNKELRARNPMICGLDPAKQ